MSDTVGFINNLPTDLVKAFRATLEEALYADLIIDVVDYSDPDYKMHMDVTKKTLNVRFWRFLKNVLCKPNLILRVGLPKMENWAMQRREHMNAIRKSVQSPKFIDQGATVVAFEEKFETVWNGLLIKGRIDRVDRRLGSPSPLTTKQVRVSRRASRMMWANQTSTFSSPYIRRSPCRTCIRMSR